MKLHNLYYRLFIYYTKCNYNFIFLILISYYINNLYNLFCIILITTIIHIKYLIKVCNN